MTYQKSVLVPLGVDETFALITQPDRLRRWQVITARVDLRAGGDYRWTVIPGNSAAGTFTEVEPGRRVVFTWGWEGSAEVPPGSSTVIITLEPAAGGTIVHLVHEGLTGEQEASHAAGWTHYLGRLVTAAAAGDAGADEWAAGPDLDPLSAAEATLAACQLVLRGVAEADYHHATVCPEFDVTQLAEHLIGSVTYLGAAAGAPAGPAPGGPLESRVAAAAQVTLEAWHARGLDGEVKVGPHEMPAGPALGILSVEFLVHGWDFAQATGQRVAVSDDLARHVLGVARQIISPEVRAGGSFADPVEAGPDAGLLDRLVAFTGRAVLSAHPPSRGNQTMPERTSYAQGTPNWVDLQTSDQDAAKAFYSGLFGWTYDDQPMPQGAVYSMAMIGGHPVAAIAPQSPELAAAGAPPMWNTYLAVDAVDEATAKVEAAGGKVAMAPFDVMDAGRMAFVLDPAGVPVALWQANQHIGAALVNEPGAVTWNELITTDPGAVKFYADVLGMTSSTMDMGGGPYTVFEVGGQMVGGTAAPQMPGVPNHWHVYFEVADADAGAAKAAELGGTVMVPPFDIPVGRIAVIGDPQGAVFSIIKSVPQPA